MTLPDLQTFLSPRSIAIVGASATPTKIGAAPLRYLIEHGFDGAIHPVNPAGGEIQGLPARTSLGAIGAPVDLAILAVPAAAVEAAVDDAAAAGVRNLVVFTAGFAELGEAGGRAQRRLLDKAHAAGMRLLGPNCLGFMNVRRRVFATFSPVVATGTVEPGSIGIVSQSGAFGAYAYGMARERGVGLSAWITTGNEADIDVADCIAWMADDPHTRVVMAYLEGCRDGARLRAALVRARDAGKPVVVVKVGRTTLGAEAAASHTAALAGNDAAFDALFRQTGAWRARSIDEFFDVAHGVATAGLPRNARVGLLTVSGGVGVLMADDASDAGLDVAPLPAAGQALIRARVPFAATRNPVDVTGQVASDPELVAHAARAMLDSGDYGSLVVFLAAAGLTPPMQAMQRRLAADLRREHPERLVVFCSLPDPAQQRALQASGCLTFSDPGRAIRLLAALAFLRSQRPGGDAREAAGGVPLDAGVMPLDAGVAPLDAGTVSLHAGTVSLHAGAYDEAEGLALLSRHGIGGVPQRRAATREDAAAAARALGFPVAIKVLSADLPHKSDVGGVVLGVADAAAAAAAFDRIMASATSAAPAARIDGVVVAPMIAGGVECIVGAHRDPVLGPIVMLGSGGVQVELLRDVAFRVAPIGLDDARAMIDELRTAPLLRGWRGAPPADVEALAATILRVAALAVAAGDSLESIDINPLAVLPAGRGVVALDAAVRGRATTDALEPAVLRTLPLFEMARMRAANTARRDLLQGFAGDGPASTLRWVNRFTHTRRLIGPEDCEVVTPNNDTLFSNAWLDLAEGPVVIDVPAMGDRYWTLGFLDAWTNPWAYAGSRTTGGQAQRLFVHGPRWSGEAPEGMHRIAAPGDDVWIIGRILVDPQALDLARVHALQDRFAIRRPDGTSATTRLDALMDGRDAATPDPLAYRAIVAAMLARNPSPHPIDGWPPADAALPALGTALASVYRRLREDVHGSAAGGGWTIAVTVRTDFGDDIETRARVARNWIGTLGIDEAMYLTAEVDADGRALHGDRHYRLRFAPGALPRAGAFWSITLYRRRDCLLVANALGRHSIGDRTRGLAADPDGGLSIVIGAEDPGAGGNWLPAPPGEAFFLVLRVYLPGPEHLEGRYAYPPIRHVEALQPLPAGANPLASRSPDPTPECTKNAPSGS